MTAITEERFAELLSDIRRSVFRLEAQRRYSIGEERVDFERFLAGSPRPPVELGWWKEYLDRVACQVLEGKVLVRVRVHEDPPTDYQRWLMWAAPWYAQAGEQIVYLARSRAHTLQLPVDEDWVLLDDHAVVRMPFSPGGEVAGKILATDPDIVARYRGWRDVALANGTPAERMAAA